MSDPGIDWTQEDIDNDMLDGEECPNCGGEGYVFDCIDGFCADAHIGCDMCTHACDWCNLPKPKPTGDTP